MRKFLLPIINLVNLILISIAWGLSGKTAIIDAGNGDYPCGNMYQVIWQGANANPVAIVGFFLFIFGCAAMLAAFIPAKWRKYVSCCAGALFIASGVLFLCSQKTYDYPIAKPELTSAFIAICVLVLIAGAFSLAMSALEFFQKKWNNPQFEENCWFFQKTYQERASIFRIIATSIRLSVIHHDIYTL